MKVGIVGFGNMGKTHAYCIDNLKYYFRDEGFEPTVYGICTTSTERTKSLCEKYGFPKAFSDFDEMVSCPEIDIIDICTPNNVHYEQLLKALEAGKHIYCEKPLCTTSEEAMEISSLAKQKGVTCAIVFNTRFHLPVIRAKELIEEGMLGEILSFSASFLHSSAMDAKKQSWKQNKDICGGGVLFDLGSHAVDMMFHLVGEFDSIACKSQVAFGTEVVEHDEKVLKTDAEEAFYMLCKMKNSAVGTITVSKIHIGTNDDFSFEIYGTKGSLKFSLMEPNWLYFYDISLPENRRGVTRIECVGRFDAPASGFPGIKAPVGWIRSHIGSMHSFLSCVSKGLQAAPSFEDGAYIQRVMDSAYKADKSGSWVKI